MCTHFKNHQGNCSCNRKLKNVAMSDNWKDLEYGGCESCKRTEQYLMAKQDSPIEVELSACGRTKEQFLDACIDTCSNVEAFINDGEDLWWHVHCNSREEMLDAIKTNGLKHYRIKAPLIVEQDITGAVISLLGYTITKDQMNDIKIILDDGIECLVEFDKDHELMKDKAIYQKDVALSSVQNIINKIKNGG